jgi:hypothetical protein
MGLIGFTFGSLKGEQNASTNLERVFQTLKARGVLFPFVMSEIGMSSAGREDEVVVGYGSIGQGQSMRGEIDGSSLRQQHSGIRLSAQNSTDGVCNISGGKSRCRDLIEQWLKEMVIAPIDQRYLNILAPQRLRRIESTESTTNDHNPRTASRLHE